MKYYFHIIFVLQCLIVLIPQAFSKSADDQDVNLFETAGKEFFEIQKEDSNPFQSAYFFNGINSSIEFACPKITNQLTFCAWIKPENLSVKNQSIFGIPGSFWFRTNLGRELQFTQPGIVDNNTSGLFLSNNNWIFVSLVIDPPRVSVFLNGKQVGEFPWRGAIKPEGQVFYLGKDHWRDDFKGTMAEIGLYRKALSGSEIQKKYDSTKGSLGITNGLVFYYPFDGKELYISNTKPRIDINQIKFPDDSIRGKVGDFNGTSGFIDFGKVPVDNATTIAVWVKPRKLDVLKGAVVSLGHAFAFRIIGRHSMRVTIPQIADVTDTIAVLIEEKWQHLAISFMEGVGLTFYINGEKTSFIPFTDYQNAEKELKVGTNLWNDFFDGSMDDLLIWNRILDEQEIKQVYAQSSQRWKDELILERKTKLILPAILMVVLVFLFLLFRRNRKTAEPEVSKQNELLQRINQLVDANLSDSGFSVDRFAEGMNMSKTKLYNLLKKETGKSPKELIRDQRIEHAAQLLLQTKLPITEIAFETGFDSRAYFNKCFRDKYNTTPSEYRNRQL